MNSFRSLTSRIILAGVAGIIVCFVLAYNFKFSCYLGKVEIAPLQYPFICTDANGTVDIWSRYVGFVFGVVVLLAAVNLEYRKGLKFEFWVTMSSLLVALIILPLYALIVSANGIDTGYYAIEGERRLLDSQFPLHSTCNHSDRAACLNTHVNSRWNIIGTSTRQSVEEPTFTGQTYLKSFGCVSHLTSS